MRAVSKACYTAVRQQGPLQIRNLEKVSLSHWTDQELSPSSRMVFEDLGYHLLPSTCIYIHVSFLKEHLLCWTDKRSYSVLMHGLTVDFAPHEWGSMQLLWRREWVTVFQGCIEEHTVNLSPWTNSCWIELSTVKATAGLCSLPAAYFFEFMALVSFLAISWFVSGSVGKLCLLGVFSIYQCRHNSRRTVSGHFNVTSCWGCFPLVKFRDVLFCHHKLDSYILMENIALFNA